MYAVECCQCLVSVWIRFLEPDCRGKDQRRVNKTEKSEDFNLRGCQNNKSGKTGCLVLRNACSCEGSCGLLENQKCRCQRNSFNHEEQMISVVFL